MKTINFLKVLTVAVLPLFLSGCVILPDEQEPRGVKLSDAMQASANGDRHDVGGHNSQDSFLDPTDTTTASTAAGSGSGAVMDAAVSYDKTDYDWEMLADVSYALPIKSQFESITRFTLTPIAIEDERNLFGFYIGGADFRLKSGSLADRATDRTWMLDAGLTYRYYFNHSRTALSPYVTASAGFNWFNWSYRNAVISDGEIFHSDSLYGAEGALAIGISTRRDYRVSAFAEAGIGGTVFAPVTVNGFDNDVFRNFGSVSFKAGLAVKF